MTATPSYDDEATVATYATFGNGRLLEVVRAHLPKGGSVLDLGCASGGLLAAVGDVADRRDGVEISASAAAVASKVADQVVVGSLTDPTVGALLGVYDVVVAADVIEHVAEPDDVLRAAAAWVDTGGVLVVCVPNIAYYKARARLLRGRWDYESSGTFDRGHLRWFTLESAVAAVAGTGLVVRQVVPVIPMLHHDVGVLHRLPRRAARGIERVWGWLGRRRPGLFAFQIIVVAQRRP